ncbi:MAG: DNA2/NAM7 family helicase [Armatimonadetes bacterium]|nr:DNA2/NAM7 family helicase [Armatimonadota bacterium]
MESIRQQSSSMPWRVAFSGEEILTPGAGAPGPGQNPVFMQVNQFVEAFQRGLELEMQAVREQVQETLIRLGPGRKLDDTFIFPCEQGVDRLFPGQSGTLVAATGLRIPVTVEEVGEGQLTLSSEVPMDSTNDFGLEVVPWFLYQKMQQELSRLLEADHPYQPQMALRVFGKLPAESLEYLPATEPTLNEAQARAVEHGLGHQLSFLWGPPGTGKTTTLARLLSRMLQNGRRVLLVSNTNTAIDQVLERMKAAGEGGLLRLGPTARDEPCALVNVVNEVHRTLVDEIAELRGEKEADRQRLLKVGVALETLRTQVEPEQLDLFGGGGSRPEPRELRELLPNALGRCAEEQIAGLEELEIQLEDRIAQTRRRISQARDALNQGREKVVAAARIVFSTLANLTVHPLLAGQTFDSVVIEEAGMAVLPAVFLAASRARLQVVVVGDPRQLPSILSSRNPLARKILGRSIFEVTVPEPESSELVSTLDTQYRMCPEIGRLVSTLFYQCGLKNAEATRELAPKTAREPFSGRGVTVVDLAGKSRCQRAPNSKSRFNEESARVAVAIARKALSSGVESMAIITPYREQVRRIDRMLRDEGLDLGRVTCSTVHRFQGHEREVVVVDTVDAPPLEPGVLLCDQGLDSASAQLLNVSLSRAQAKLIVLAELQYLLSRPTGVLGDLLRQAVAQGQAVRVAIQAAVQPRAPVGGTGTRSDWD